MHMILLYKKMSAPCKLNVCNLRQCSSVRCAACSCVSVLSIIASAPPFSFTCASYLNARVLLNPIDFCRRKESSSVRRTQLGRWIKFSTHTAAEQRHGSSIFVSQQVQPFRGNKIHRLARRPHQPSGGTSLRGSIPRAHYRTRAAMATKEMSRKGFTGGEARVNG
jgi:hypothetical protein